MDALVYRGYYKERSRNYRAPLLAAAGVAVLLGGLFLWRTGQTQAQEAPPPPPQAVSASLIRPQPMPVTLDAIGTLRAVRQVTLTAEVPGRIVRIMFASGARAGRGQALVQLNDRPERASQRSYGATARLAGVQLARASELVALGAEAQETVDRHRAERQQAQAEIGRIGATIAQKTVHAPFSGTLGLRRVDVGQYLNPGDPIATLTDLGEMYVEFQLPQKYLAAARRGMPLELVSDSWPGRTFVARIEATEPQISASSRNVLVQARIANRDGALRPGMYVDVDLKIEGQADAIAVPASAIVSSAAGEAVFVVDKPGKDGVGTAKLVPVKTGNRQGNQVVIVDGLAAGQYVVTAGQLRIRPDIPVRIATPNPGPGVRR